MTGGNSKTAMVAALSPADINFDETLSTLRSVWFSWLSSIQHDHNNDDGHMMMIVVILIVVMMTPKGASVDLIQIDSSVIAPMQHSLCPCNLAMADHVC